MPVLSRVWWHPSRIAFKMCVHALTLSLEHMHEHTPIHIQRPLHVHMQNTHMYIDAHTHKVSESAEEEVSWT